MKRFLLAPFLFYSLALALGVALRFFFVAPFGGIDFGNAVHAHSHTLYFGWAGLGIFALAYARLGATDRVVRRVLTSIAIISAATFVVFLEGGYSLPGIVVSTVALGVWAAALVVFLRRARGRKGVDVSFLRWSMAYIVLASLGATARVVFLVMKVEDPLPGKLAVFAFLYDFAWFFVLAVFGLLAWIAPRLGTRLDDRLLRVQLALTVPFAWLTFPLGVPGGSEGWLGTVASVAALVLLLPATVGCLNLWRAARTALPGARAGLRFLAFWLGAQALMEAAGAFGLAEIALASRHLAIAYLHVLLVGLVSGGLALALLAHLGVSFGHGLWCHHLGLLVMAIGLGMGGAGVVGLGALAPAGLWVATFGGAAVFAAALHFAWQAAHALRGERAAGVAAQRA